MKLSPQALDYLRKMLALEVSAQVKAGQGDEPMPEPWTELHTFAIAAERGW